MSDFDRREFIKATAGLGTVGLAGLAGCTGGPTEGDATTSTSGAEDTTSGAEGTTSEDGDGTTEQTTASADETTNVGMVYATGGLGDGSFNDQAQQGIEEAANNWNVEYQQAQPDSVSAFKNFQQQFASSTSPNYDLVTCVGYLQADALAETSGQYPDQKFQIIDSVVDAPNVASYTFQEHEGSFLVGVLAAMLTTMSFDAGAGSTDSGTTNVGFVGGVEGSLIGKFEAGYKAGVKHTNADVNVQTTYVGSFNDPTGGREAALAMYNSGADVVYHASGNTGTGVFQAAQQKGRYAIGVDRDQSVTKSDYADVILASMVKRVDTAVVDAVESVVNNNFQGGSTTTLGLQDDGVACVYGQQLGPEIPSDVKSAVSSARESIIAGDISVPSNPDNV